jgi:hypothetical protein
VDISKLDDGRCNCVNYVVSSERPIRSVLHEQGKQHILSLDFPTY